MTKTLIKSLLGHRKNSIRTFVPKPSLKAEFQMIFMSELDEMGQITRSQ